MWRVAILALTVALLLALAGGVVARTGTAESTTQRTVEVALLLVASTIGGALLLAGLTHSEPATPDTRSAHATGATCEVTLPSGRSSPDENPGRDSPAAVTVALSMTAPSSNAKPDPEPGPAPRQPDTDETTAAQTGAVENTEPEDLVQKVPAPPETQLTPLSGGDPPGTAGGALAPLETPRPGATQEGGASPPTGEAAGPQSTRLSPDADQAGR